jgi:hypothetical protein
MQSGSSGHQTKERTRGLASQGVWLWERRYRGAYRGSSGRWEYGTGFLPSKNRGQN